MFDDTRSAWGARSIASTAYVPVSPSRRTEFMVHYDGGAALGLAEASAHSACLARVKSDQVFHMDTRGYADIAYHGLVCAHGRAIEGRPIDAQGAHCYNHNTSGYGFQFMVGGSEYPTPAALARMARLLADCQARSGHTLAGLGHRDGFATECPGDQIYAWVHSGLEPAAGSGSTVVPSHPPVKPPAQTGEVPAYPLPTGYWYGPRDGGDHSISGCCPVGKLRTVGQVKAGLARWQQRMRDRGWTIAVDGVYGSQTAGVARRFAAEKGLRDSHPELIGPSMWAAAWTQPVTP